ncbi:MAG: DUF2513 domain-containing protein [Atopobiaceae bacterium]|nr:DUF2513 domain-containing protein [Atopobiaceae bacterium]
MRRDKDLIRRIVLDVADTNEVLEAKHWEDEKNSHEKVGYHIRLLEEEGYLKASFLNADNDPYYAVLVSKLTMKGQDLAESLRSPSEPEKEGDKLAEVAKDVGVDVIKTVTAAAVASKLGIGA